jgi:hypothetical protein
LSPGLEDIGCGAQLGSAKCSKLQYCPPINSNQEVVIALTLISAKPVIQENLTKVSSILFQQKYRNKDKIEASFTKSSRHRSLEYQT